MVVPIEERNAEGIFLRLSDVYFVGVIVILTCGMILTLRVSLVFVQNYKKLNSVVKSYMSVILPDLFMVFNFLPRDLWNIHHGRLTTGTWCTFSAFVAIMAITALNSGAVCVAYSTWRLVQGNPMPDKLVLLWNLGSWVFAILLSAIFAFGGLLGPYKGLYCCVRETEYRAYAVAPIVVVTFTAIAFMSMFYYNSYLFIKQAEGKRGSAAGAGDKKASDAVLWRGILLVSVFYGCWSIIIFAGVGTSLGATFHPLVDIFGAWLAKLMPSIDSFILLQMLNRITEKKGNKVGASEAESERPKPAAGAGGGGAQRPAVSPAAASKPAATPTPSVPTGSKSAIDTPAASATPVAPKPAATPVASTVAPAPTPTSSEPNPFIPPPLMA